ncbi:hypothetical protein TNCT_94801 [Trichonephila clavata]|uniref:Uncharacterized protein n=1 Tax=Trichonephila clavata TaxID=2740835 RepID=A0A8X6KX95_TRICU|nr:hypothetical protein TNCT_94801 [Trichonephila clavata]
MSEPSTSMETDPPPATPEERATCELIASLQKEMGYQAPRFDFLKSLIRTETTSMHKNDEALAGLRKDEADVSEWLEHKRGASWLRCYLAQL